MKAHLARILTLSLITATVIAISCKKKDGSTQEPSVFKTTPYVYPVALPVYVPPPSFPADNPQTVEGVNLGRYLFYDSSLSVNYTIACASCHHQAYAFTDRGRPLSLGVHDSIGTFNSMALFNIPWERGGFFWNARAPILDSQIVGPVANNREMDFTWPQAVARLQATKMYPPMYQAAFGSSTITKENTVKAIAQFLRSIISFNSKYDSVEQGLAVFTPSEHRGFTLFTTDPIPNTDTANHIVALGHRIPGTGVDCFHCHHTPPDFIPEPSIPDNAVLQNDGLGTINLKVPSLRNLKFSAPYMSDGSFATLDSVIDHYDHHIDPGNSYTSSLMYAKKYTDPNNPLQLVTGNMELSTQEKADLIAFLNTLNDYKLITNKAYSNPFMP